MSREKRFLQCPECREKIFQSDERCMNCGANLVEYRRQAAAEEAAHEEDWIGKAARGKILEDARIEAEAKSQQPAGKARESADHFAWAAVGSVVLGVLGLVEIVGATEDYTLGVGFLLGGIGWCVIFLAGSRLLRCLAELTENVASIERTQRRQDRPDPDLKLR